MIGVIPNIVFVILIALATGYLTFLTTKGGLTDNRFSGTWKKLTNRGRLVILTLVLISGLLVLQEWNSQVKNDSKDFLMGKERIQRDSIITNRIELGVDSNRKTLFKDLSQALAKQGLEFDSNQKRIEKLVKDSSKITIYENEAPILHLVSIGATKGIEIIKDINGEITIEVQILSSDAGSTGFEIVYSIFKSISNGDVKYVGEFSPLNYSSKLSTNQGHISPYIIPNDNFGLIDKIFIWARGKYRNIDLSKNYYLDEVYYYDVKESIFGDLKGKTREIILNNVKMQKK